MNLQEKMRRIGRKSIQLATSSIAFKTNVDAQNLSLLWQDIVIEFGADHLNIEFWIE